MEGLHYLKWVLRKKVLHVQTRTEGCKFLYCFSTQRFTKIITVSLCRKLVQVPVSLLWFATSSQNIHKIIKGSSLSFETSDDKGHNLSRRFIDFGKRYEGNTYGKGLRDLPIATSRLCDKFEEVCVQEKEFLGLIVNSQTLTFSLPEEKIGKIKDQCLSLYKASEVSLLDLTKLIETLYSTIEAELPVPLQFCFLHQKQILYPKQTQSYLTLVKLTPKTKNELLWWVNNLELCIGRLVIQPLAQVLIQTDTSKKGWRVVCREIRTRGQWSKKEQYVHISHLELSAIKFAILIFPKMWKMSALHIQAGNKIALSYFLKMRGRKNPELIQISKEIWEFPFRYGITITAEHLPGNLNCKADWESWHQKDSTEWKLCPLRDRTLSM